MSIENDKEVFLGRLSKIANKYGFKIHNVDLYFMAFTHPSYANEHKVPHNERLEYLGDAILDFLVSEYLYLTYPAMQEGGMSKTRSKYICEQANSEYSLIMELDKCFLLGRGEEEGGGRAKIALLADLFEAFLGAVYLDNSIVEVKNILTEVIFKNIVSINQGFFVDYKTKLQECMRSESPIGLQYIVEDEDGPAHSKTFTVSVFHDGVRMGTGIGKSKKEAEQKAAEEALNKLAK